VIGVLPRGFDDELLYGLIARYLAAFGEARLFRRGRDVRLGVPSVHPLGLLGLPIVLALGQYPAAAEEFQRYLFDHTVAPYILACLPAYQASEFVRRLLVNGGLNADGVVTTMLLGRGFGTLSVRLRLCERCVARDEVVVGRSYWHRCHQLPCTRVCWKHKCWLYEVLTLPSDVLFVTPREVPDSLRRRLGNVRPSGLAVQLAIADRAMLEAGQHGFIGPEVRQAYIDRIESSPRAHAYLVPPRETFKTCVLALKRQGERLVAVKRHDRWLRPLLDDLDDHDAHRCDEHFTMPSRHVLALTLAGTRIDEVSAACRERQRCDASADFELCGDRQCSRFRATWKADLEARATDFNIRVRACCYECGFRACAAPYYEAVFVDRPGKKWLELAVELHEENILTEAEQALILGVDVDTLRERRWKHLSYDQLLKSGIAEPWTQPASRARHDWRRLPTLV
jgi:hypothetical protein